MTAPAPRRVPPLVAGSFVVAFLGVLAMLGAVVARLGGVVALAGYAVVVTTALLLAGVRLRRQARNSVPPQRAAGRTCSCCTSSVHDPVEVR